MALTDNLVAYWRLYEGGETRNDSAGSYDLTDGASVGQVSGPVYNAASFVAAESDYLTKTSEAALQHNQDLSYALWVYLDTLTTGGFLGKWDSTNGRECIINYSTAVSRFRFTLRNAADSASHTVDADNFGAPSADTWYFIYCYFDKGTGLGISVNDGTVDTLAETGDMNTGTSPLIIGAQNEDIVSPLDGRIADFGRWNKVLTSGEVTSLYNSGNGLTYPFDGHPIDVWVPNETAVLT